MMTIPKTHIPHNPKEAYWNDHEEWHEQLDPETQNAMMEPYLAPDALSIENFDLYNTRYHSTLCKI
jgi:hypothetical protein